MRGDGSNLEQSIACVSSVEPHARGVGHVAPFREVRSWGTGAALSRVPLDTLLERPHSRPMGKTKPVAAPSPDARSRRIDLLPADVVRLSALVKFYRSKLDPVSVTEIDAIRLSLKDACILNGLEQRTDVEPIGADVSNGSAGR